MSALNDWKINLASMYTILSKRPIFVAWLITHRCNLRCKFCNYWKREVATDKELAVEEFGQVSKTLAKLGVRAVNLAGGEPFVRRDLPDIVAQLSSDHVVIINTNGTLVNESNARAIYEAGTDIVNVSIDYFSREKHDHYRGPGVYDKAMNALLILREARTRKRQKVAIQTIMAPDNLDEIEQLVKHAEKLGIDFTFNPYRPGDHSVDLTVRQPFDIKSLYALKRPYRSFRATIFALQKTDEYLASGFIPDCCAAKYMFAIDPYGQVVPCEDRIQTSIGDIRGMSVIEIAAGLDRMHTENSCQKCWTRERSEVEVLYHWNGLGWFRNLLDVRK